VAKVSKDPDDYDYTLRRTVHTKLYAETHARLKVKAAELKLSVQEIFNELGTLVGNDDPRLLSILKEYKRNKRRKQDETLVGKGADVDEIYGLIGDNSPLKDG
jgi:hypothetical protein